MQGRKLLHKITSFPAGKLPVEYLIHKKPFKLLVFCTSVKCTITGEKKAEREIMTGRKISFPNPTFGRQVCGTHILASICIENQKNVLVTSIIFYILSGSYIYFVQPNHPFLTFCYYILSPS